MRRPTLHDVAAEAGVSIKTVSRVVNGSHQVSPDLRTRVEAVVDRMHYVPNTLARNLKVGSGDTIGVVIDTIADPFFAALTHAVEARALQAGLNVVFGSTGFVAGRERAQVERLAMQQVRGLVLAPVTGDHAYLSRFRAVFPVVVVDRTLDVEGYDAVVVDDHGATRDAIDHLLAHGHRRIAFVGRDERFPTTQHRLGGYRDALERAGVPFDPALVPDGRAEEAESEAAVRALLDGGPGEPTAVFSANPRASLGVAHGLHALGRTDVAFVSFGDFPLARTLSPAVTCVDQDPDRIGTVAMDQLLRRLGLDGRPAQADAERIVVPAALVPRGSGEIEVTR